MLKAYLPLLCLSRLLNKSVKFVVQVLVHSIESFFKHSIEVRHREFAKPEFILMGNGVIALGDSLVLVPWQLRVSLTPRTTIIVLSSVFVHPRQREGLRVLEEML